VRAMTNTQYNELIKEIRAMRAVLERSAALAETLANPAQAQSYAEMTENVAPAPHVPGHRLVSATTEPLSTTPRGKKRGRK
jgi:hypothetical protein